MNSVINIDPQSIRRILVCQLRQIGDVLLATPSVKLLAERFPHAEIHFFTEKKCLPMLENNPHIKKIWVIDKNKNFFEQIALYRSIGKNNFDIIVDFQQLPRCKQLLFFCPAKIKLTFPPPWYNRIFYTHWHAEPEVYAAQAKAGALVPLGIKWNGEKPELFLTQAEKNQGKQELQSMGIDMQKPLITIDATHIRQTRCWPHYAKLMNLLFTKLPEVQFLLPYGPGEKEAVLQIRQQCNLQNKIFIPEGLLSLRGMAACMELSSMHIGNCSSPRHIAVAVGLPSVTILGSTGTNWTFPSKEHIHLQKLPPCQPCYKNTCELAYRCLNEFLPEEVLPKVLEHYEAFAKQRIF